ncbi:putative D-3-phosphoglycerate dehydrogenase [Talaromyces proteolyticus]|uniref:D-3-phosphoglycerate dehydrogenase n=1 Tax=Talaromyces proteolyticus TaxID=1131652 RepID=A0AAD4L1P5_9EURO|nr:putative D-3-phosphoglycerate dehydrogenase [Talaromyces proteolyticus]KAH8701609.1 putative D-3-phosphoglycerate dehydrogenase [Talaromyces proteolyticus]
MGSMPEFTIYILDPFHPDAVALVQSIPYVRAILPDDPHKANWHADADGIMVRSDSRLTEADFAKASCLRAVVKQGVGVDNIDLEGAKKHGIAIHNTPALNSESVAELSMALTLTLSRRVGEIDRAVRSGQTVIRSQVLSTSMFRKTVGVVGMGNIGKIIAQKWIGAFGCQIIAYDPYAAPSAWNDIQHTRVEALDDLLKVADVVTLHVPLVDSTRGLIGAHEFGVMKKTAILVNCSRGGVVDEKTLLVAIEKKQIGGAALDVMEIEPPTLSVYGEFLKHENVIMTPHIGGSTKENQSRSGMAVAETLMDVLEGREAGGKLV